MSLENSSDTMARLVEEQVQWYQAADWDPARLAGAYTIILQDLNNPLIENRNYVNNLFAKKKAIEQLAGAVLPQAPLGL